MDDRTLDSKITECLIKETDEAVKLKKDIWTEIQNNIQNEKQRGIINMFNEKKKKSIFTTIVSTAAALAIFFFVGTETGRAAAAKVKEFFAPEKEIVQELEGQNENTDVTLEESEIGYIIYIDESRYQKESVDGKDRIVFKEKLDSNIPAVYMEIEQIKDKSPEDLATQIEGELKSNFTTVRNEGQVTEPLKAINLYARNGDEWNSKVVEYYLVDNGKGGAFVIKQQFFYEASEGHGVRFDNMLKEFKIIEIGK